jgi:hypothetical protein
MRSRRTLTVRVASLGGALALIGAGLAGSVGLVASSTNAGADTNPYSATCTLTVSGAPVPEVLNGLVTTGSLSPSAPASGKTFTLSNFALQFGFGSLAAAIIGDTLSGTVTGSVTASGATPASQAVTYTIPPTVIVANQPPIAASGSAVSFTAGSGSPPATVSTGTSVTLNLNISGTIGHVPGTCSTPAEVIASAPAPAALTAVLPNAAPPAGGTTVIIHGSGIGSPDAVEFGATPATHFTPLTPNSVRAVVPPGTGTVEVAVTTVTGLTNKIPFTYTNGPIVTGVAPSTGNPSGGATVQITGLQLSGATAVHFGSTAAGFTANSPTSVTATSPAGSGVVNVTVSNGLGTSVTSALDQFNYRAGYWLGASDGGVFTYGNAPFEGSAGAITLNKPVVGLASTPDAGGYWLVASDGGIFSYGDATFYGSAGNLTLNKPIVGMAATPGGFGYWLVASDGGVFSYGDAQFFGSTGAITLNKPIVGMASTPDGGGYWLVASDGGVFAFGDAAFHGSLGGTPLRGSVVGIASTPDGGGYWVMTSDGGVFPYGDAVFYGSMSGIVLNAPVVGTAGSSDGAGYWLAASDGGIFSYGDAAFYGSAGGIHLNKPIVGVAGA